jgi:hypothetical protein
MSRKSIPEKVSLTRALGLRTESGIPPLLYVRIVTNEVEGARDSGILRSPNPRYGDTFLGILFSQKMPFSRGKTRKLGKPSISPRKREFERCLG